MVGIKKHVISIRVDDYEKKLLEARASKLEMSLANYSRYCLLSEEKGHLLQSTQKESAALRFLDYNTPFLFRMLIKTMMKVEKLAEKTLDKKEINESNNEEYQIIKNLKISTDDEDFTSEERVWKKE